MSLVTWGLHTTFYSTLTVTQLKLLWLMDFTADVTGYFLNKVQQGGENKKSRTQQTDRSASVCLCLSLHNHADYINHYQLDRFHRIVSVLIRYLVCLLSYGNRPTHSAQTLQQTAASSCLLLQSVISNLPSNYLVHPTPVSPLPHCFSPTATTAGPLISHFVEVPGVRTYFWGQTREAATPSHRQKNSGWEFDPLPGHRVTADNHKDLTLFTFRKNFKKA